MTVSLFAMAVVTVSVITMFVVACISVSVVVIAVAVISVAVISVAMSVTMPVMSWGEKLVSAVIVRCVSQSSVLEIATKQALLRERRRILDGVDSPAVVASEEERALIFNCDFLLEVVLEQLARGTSVVGHLLNFLL